MSVSGRSVLAYPFKAADPFHAATTLATPKGLAASSNPSRAAWRPAASPSARYSLRRLRSHVSLSAAWYKADNVQRFSDEGETIMARFVQMPIAGGQQGQFVIVNIDLVRYIRSVKTGQATVYFDDEQSLTVAMDAQQIAEAANGA
jgi:hypothetical protein